MKQYLLILIIILLSISEIFDFEKMQLIHTPNVSIGIVISIFIKYLIKPKLIQILEENKTKKVFKKSKKKKDLDDNQ